MSRLSATCPPSHITNGCWEGVVVSPAGAEAQSSDAPPAVTIATVLLCPVKIFVLPHSGSEYLAFSHWPALC